MTKSLHLLTRSMVLFLFLLAIGLAVYIKYGTPPFNAVPTTSMVPTLNVGDLVVIKPISADQVKQGDIVVVDIPKSTQKQYQYPPRIIHRIDKVTESPGLRTFSTKGDHNAAEDPFTVYPKDIKGIYVSSYPKIGFIVLFLNSPQGHLFLYLSLGLYLFYILFEELNRRHIRIRSGLSKLIFNDFFEEASTIKKLQEENLQTLSKLIDVTDVMEMDLAEKKHMDHHMGHTLPFSHLKDLKAEVNQMINWIETEREDPSHSLFERALFRLRSIEKHVEDLMVLPTHESINLNSERNEPEKPPTPSSSLPPRREKKRRLHRKAPSAKQTDGPSPESGTEGFPSSLPSRKVTHSEKITKKLKEN